MKRIPAQFTTLAAIVASTLFIGCSEQPQRKAPPKTDAKTTQPAEHKHDSHGHGAGPHEGTLADWGGGKYHVEFTVDHGKKEATIYVLGSDERTPAPIKAKDGKLLLTISQPSIQADLKATPQEGDPEGTASRFVGQHDNLGIVQEYAGTISGEVDGTPYAGDFKEEPHSHEP